MSDNRNGVSEANGNTFYKITNKDIYTKLESIEKRLDSMEGQYKTIKWIAGTAITLSLLVLGFLIQHVTI